MLDKSKMQLVERQLCQTLDVFNAGNGQPIREKLLRQAVKSCDEYATDIIIVINQVIPELFTKNLNEIDLYFVKKGIDWVYEDGIPYSKEVHQYYRYAMKVVKYKDTLFLYERYGNV